MHEVKWFLHQVEDIARPIKKAIKTMVMVNRMHTAIAMYNITFFLQCP